MLWDRCFAIDAEASSAFAAALRRRHSESRTGVELAANDLRQAGFLIRTFVDAFAHTGDKAYLEAIDALLVACEANRRADRRSAVPAPRPANCNAVYALSLAIDCDGAARKTPEPLRSRLAGFAAGIDASFCALPHDIREKQPFATEFGASADSPPHRTSLWNPADGRYTTAAVAVMCVSRYTNTGNIEFRELIVAAADAYLDALPADDVDAWPLAFSQAITLELAAFRITADGRYHARAFQLGQIAVEKFFGDSPLPRASLKSDHYEAATGGDSLALALAELHLSTRTITAVRTPANTLDR
jgi:hypothetical protein